jgi:amino acid transporter
VLATIIVLSNLAGVAVQFLYQFIGSAVNSEMISGLWEKKLINVVTCLVFLAIATYVAYRGVDTTERVQMVLVIFQLVMLAIFAVLAIAKSGASEVGQPRMHRRDLSEPGVHCETSRRCVIRSRRLRIP